MNDLSSNQVRRSQGGMLGPLQVVVTGGAGILGRRIVSELLSGRYADVEVGEVRVFDIEAYEPTAARVSAHVGDIRDLDALQAVCTGADIVFHCAALIDWGQRPEAEVASVNVDGTRNVVRACRSAGVPALVHTSTLDVVYSGTSIIAGDERLPKPRRHANAYCRTKAAAEELVLAAHAEAGAPRVAVIRPLSIFGEGDRFHLGTLLELARPLPLIRIGDGSSLAQFVYVGNLAHAHILAGLSLLRPDSPAAGQAYFITDFPPRNFFDFFEPMITALGGRVMPRWAGLPRGPMYGLGLVLETGARLLNPVVRLAPSVTTFSVDFLCLDMTFDGAKAVRDLGYRPIYTEDEAFERTIDWFREHGPR